MSRVGNKVITLPTDVSVTLNQGVATVKGSKGTLSLSIPQGISFSQVAQR
jgi:large subunit ribosomal protein L6